MDKINFFKKLTIIIGISLLIIIWFYIKTFIPDQQNCFHDPLLKSFMPINKSLNNKTTLQNFILILNGLMFDSINGYFWLYYFIFKNKFVLSVFIFSLFYFMRQFIYLFFWFPISKSTLFHDPHFYSIIITYRNTNDFYYSGHTGNMLFYILYFYLNKKYKLMCFTIIFIIYTILMLLFFSAHYTIDILFGIIVMFYSFFIFYSNKYKINLLLINILDNFLIFFNKYIFNIKENSYIKLNSEDEDSKKLI